jgi:SAM-dependent methyltransferase
MMAYLGDLAARAKQFGVVLEAARKRAEPVGFEWYEYHSLSNVHHLEKLLDEEALKAGRDEGILDLGCGDGDLAFFFESLAYAVTAMDYGPSNQNGMRGVRSLQRQLGSTIALREVDVDSEFPLDSRYGLTLCLGLLYHLKNPFYVLERVARVSRYCVLSTRIARRLPGGAPMPGDHALAYLVGEEELNQDDTNFWIFSEPGLRRLLERTRWEIVEFFTTGDKIASDPVSSDHDERAFCLLRSHYGCEHLELLEGWHHVEESGWRWTERRFAVRATGRGVKHSRMAMRLYAPPALIEKFGRVSLRAKIDGVEVEPLVMREAGIHHLVRKIAMPSEVTSVTFELDNALGVDAGYSRELGIIVASLEFT